MQHPTHPVQVDAQRRQLLTTWAAVAAASTWPLHAAAQSSATSPPANAATPAATTDLARRFDAFVEDSFWAYLALDPLGGSEMTGDPRFEGQLEITISPQHRAKMRALTRQTQDTLQRFDRDALDATRRRSHDMLREQLEQDIAWEVHPHHLMPVSQYGGLPAGLANLGSGDQHQALRTPTDHANFQKRLAKLPAWVDQAIANMREGMATGFTVPRPLAQRALDSLTKLAAPDFATSPWSQPLRRIPAKAGSGWSDAQRLQAQRGYADLFKTALQPATAKLVSFLRRDYIPACRTSAGLSALPDGAAWYAKNVRYHTTTAMTPQQIHDLGLSEVARIQREIQHIQAAWGQRGTVVEFLRWHDQAPQYHPFTSVDQILRDYHAVDQRIQAKLPALFNRRPTQALVIREIPELQRSTGSSHYLQPAQDGSRPGTFFLWVDKPERINSSETSSLLLHEGQPGHHFHISLQQKLPLPAFRRFGWVTAYGEGWGLYAETLGNEMGLYDDLNQRLGWLKLELVRAVRLVTDTGLHALGWSREKTIAYMMDTEGVSETVARIATERYMADPGQALAYKIGAMKIMALRQKATTALGDRFQLARFHDLVLSEGAVPLSVLEQMVDEWVAAGGPAVA